ncbi:MULTISPECIES: DNA-processing protein DprA [unclassified Bacillus (in: firmicutes)]|uniref:DNA-processing protein DprA n=1 Tax=unclassified Bacillus (in: firmicutes) TaxID=185979 RepID=UPI0008F38E4E|nr:MULTISPECIES: DNA-processing protein DprA [unclassified Bacillus (in: firmicutes)]SFA74236.1 DNA processing protein [Bacillus sp. UNCCL13]SFQ64474.1 DNA processing protein [Bacillus sp. cl95]
MDDFKRRLVHLLHCPNISWSAVYNLLKKDPHLHNVYQLSSFDSLKRPLNATESLKTPSTELILEQMRQYETNAIKVITIFDKEYPPALKEIYQPPWALFAKGNIELLKLEPKLAVVGSRQATQYGKNAIRLLFPDLIERGIVIVSGLAKGIDAIAHECTLRNGGQTIAVIAGGFYHIYPKENLSLAMELMKTHLVISEYPPDTKPSKWHFPMRNRIISGLSKGTLIIEAKRKSGSLITANYAVNEGREVFSLPGSIFNPFSNGTNELIQQGAKLVTTAEDILVEIRN